LVPLPYYSRPDVIFNRTGEPLGDAYSNTAALIMGNRHRLAAVGNESKAWNNNQNRKMEEVVVYK
jgi:hypothetical protein